MRTRILPPTYLMTGLILMGIMHFLASGPRLVFGWWRLAGVAVAALGAGIAVWADSIFKRVGTEVKPFLKSQAVVEEGPFGFTRHPMYLGFSGVVLGFAVLAGTLAPLLLVGPMIWIFYALFAVPEERHMEEQFGSEYREYCSRVGRWV